jgi:hypothetical protein
MNKYYKYCPNVYIAQCETEYQKGDLITVTNQYGKEKDHIVHNLIAHKNNSYYYSITRADGYNVQERAKRKVELYENAAINANKRSKDAHNSLQGMDFLALGEPIKVGHHSEKRHRALIARNDNKMRKSYEEMEKAKEYKQKAEYLARNTDIINLSMPESLEYYKNKLAETKAYQAAIKSGELDRKVETSLVNINNAIKALIKNIQYAEKLWGVM